MTGRVVLLVILSVHYCINLLSRDVTGDIQELVFCCVRVLYNLVGTGEMTVPDGTSVDAGTRHYRLIIIPDECRVDPLVPDREVLARISAMPV